MPLAGRDATLELNSLIYTCLPLLKRRHLDASIPGTRATSNPCPFLPFCPSYAHSPRPLVWALTNPEPLPDSRICYPSSDCAALGCTCQTPPPPPILQASTPPAPAHSPNPSPTPTTTTTTTPPLYLILPDPSAIGFTPPYPYILGQIRHHGLRLSIRQGHDSGGVHLPLPPSKAHL